MIGTIWHAVFFQPITTTLLWLSSFTGNIGVSVVLLTVIIQLILVPLRLPSLLSAKKLRHIKPKIDELKEQHGEDKVALAQAQMALYQEHGINPFGGLLPTLFSIPIIIALYQVLLNNITHIENSSVGFLWLNVTQHDPYFVLPILVGVLQFFASSQMMAQPAPAQPDKKKVDDTEQMMVAMQTQMKFIFPVLSGIITASLPSGVGLYWLTSTLFAIIQHEVIERIYKHGSSDHSNATN
ncbi:membrane protein insertase YidC [candidate division WWE3 bacterium]|nr:membrane protein insertase YidC [candidate division WWE3 bacterium]